MVLPVYINYGRKNGNALVFHSSAHTVFVSLFSVKMSSMSSQYVGKIIVAPMVRVCTLPFRLLTIDYGTDLVYTEETIDYKILRSVKRHNGKDKIFLYLYF